ncbi:hypothetical protein EOD41_10755 [Mucilaginibacter limnophilus]|uniref:Uncharacterized protein n=2 Tax=Mucilaginibacter limnophilus TaxID=1932778 RepID=A0A3S2VMZ1_9SPHI|nr:hypothetical protein EOD41_10755 [Mucilaginibacter limnophilus]
MGKVDKKGKPIPFSITAVTCDLERNRGGERHEYPKAVLTTPGGGKKQYHNRNSTRRIKLIPSDQIRTIDPLLITRFNGKEVYL